MLLRRRFFTVLCAAAKASGSVPGLKATMYWPGILFFASSLRTGASFRASSLPEVEQALNNITTTAAINGVQPMR